MLDLVWCSLLKAGFARTLNGRQDTRSQNELGADVNTFILFRKRMETIF